MDFDEIQEKTNEIYSKALDHIEHDRLEKLLINMKKYKVAELKCRGYHIKMHEHEDDIPDHVKEKLEELEKSNQVSDDEIMFDPYAGMEMDNE